MKTLLIILLGTLASIANPNREPFKTTVFPVIKNDPLFYELLSTKFLFHPTLSKSIKSEGGDEIQHVRYFESFTCLAQEKSSRMWTHSITIKIENNSEGNFINVREVTITAFRKDDSWPCFTPEKVIQLMSDRSFVEIPKKDGQNFYTPKAEASNPLNSTSPALKLNGEEKT